MTDDELMDARIADLDASLTAGQVSANDRGEIEDAELALAALKESLALRLPALPGYRVC